MVAAAAPLDSTTAHRISLSPPPPLAPLARLTIEIITSRLTTEFVYITLRRQGLALALLCIRAQVSLARSRRTRSTTSATESDARDNRTLFARARSSTSRTRARRGRRTHRACVSSPCFGSGNHPPYGVHTPPRTEFGPRGSAPIARVVAIRPRASTSRARERRARAVGTRAGTADARRRGLVGESRLAVERSPGHYGES